nr:MAG TPA: ASCH domain protein [Bacteriophage sp.]
MMVKPILFNTEMVRAILDRRKSCTRRLVKPQPDEKHTYPLGFVTDSTEKKEVGCFGFGIDEYGGSVQYAKPPYQPGDTLYVRETFIQAAAHIFWYKADDNSWISEGLHWKPSIHMPKEAARIWLKVTDVRVERLQDITVDGCHREGINIETSAVTDGETLNRKHDFSLEKFETLWDSTI